MEKEAKPETPASMTADEPVTLLCLTTDLLRLILLASGAISIANAACTCRRFRALAEELRHTPACASTLVLAVTGELEDSTWAARFCSASKAAVRTSLGKLHSASVSFVILAASPLDSHRVRLPALLEAVEKLLPTTGQSRVPLLGMSSSAVLGPRTHGVVEEHEDAVVALAVSLPLGYTATVASPAHNHGFRPGTEQQHTDAELLLRRWLCAEPECVGPPLWTTFFADPEGMRTPNEDNTFADPSLLSRVFPTCAIVGGVARSMAVMNPQGSGAQRVPVATMTVWATSAHDGGSKLRCGALATRGLVPFNGAVRVATSLDCPLDPGFEPVENQLLPHMIETRQLEGSEPRTHYPEVPDPLLADLLLARSQNQEVYLDVWGDSDEETRNTRAGRSFSVDWGLEFGIADKCITMVPLSLARTLTKKRPVHRILCQLMKLDAGAARECTRKGAEELATYVTAGCSADVPRCVVSAICNGRGADMFGEEHVEASLLGAAFNDAVLGIVAGGELGPLADISLGNQPMPAEASLQAFTNCFAALGMPGASV